MVGETQSDLSLEHISVQAGAAAAEPAAAAAAAVPCAACGVCSFLAERD